MDQPPDRRQALPDDLPRSAIADPPLSLEARTPGPRGTAPKIGLAALALVILFALVAGFWAAAHLSRPPVAHPPPADIVRP
ncbi:MAG TPA: hypothetical protein VHV27_05520 [Phenylobacterium sp.]|jgi:hypothetical protein|nr:hypothetical protein [Phenylobacterium sp.]